MSTAAMAAASMSSAEILRRTTSFLSRVLAQPDVRHRLLSTFCRRIWPADQDLLKAFKIAAETLENAASTSNPSVGSSSLRLAEKLLLSKSTKCTSLSFLLSLIYSLCHQPINAALSLLDIFSQDPSLARSEVAPSLFEELFLVHLIPVLQWFSDERSRIFSSSVPSPSITDANGEFSCDFSVVVPSEKLLSSMSGDQAAKLKELEGNYEEAINENCRVLSEYFKEVLRDKDGGRGLKHNPPSAILEKKQNNDGPFGSQSGNVNGNGNGRAMEKSRTEELRIKNGRYNPIWAEAERSAEYTTNRSSLPSYPQRVSPKLLRKQRSSSFSSELESPSSEEEDSSAKCCSISTSSESDPEAEPESKEKNRKMASYHKQKQPIPGESSRTTPDRAMSDPGKCTPPKDFVCPITSNLFDDPVTLETGQTYERRAIKEWLERGNSTCPITRQKLHSTQLPRTNYVLKRLIGSWQEKNPGVVKAHNPQEPEAEPEPEIQLKSSSPMPPSTSPTSVISILDRTMAQLRHTITKLCMSEILQESEMAVLKIERFWRDVNMEESDMMSMLSKPPVINGFVEILFNSVDPKVLGAAVFLLCELGWRDEAVVNTLTQVDSDVDCIIALFKKGLIEAVVLIYLLRPPAINLVEMEILDSLVEVIMRRNGEEDSVAMCVDPKTASVLLLDQILATCVEEGAASLVASKVVNEKVIESVMISLEAEWVEERIAAVGILSRCIQEDGKCRNLIANKVELAPVLESFIGANDAERFEIIQFLSELIKLNRRSFNSQVLHIIKEEGPFSTMHTLLNYLQTASVEHSPIVAGLLLQLDLLAEPRKMSIFREEAIDALISCLRNTDFPSAQVAAAETIASLLGRFSISGKPLIRAFLLKRAGLDKKYRAIMRQEKLGSTSVDIDESSQEEQKAADDWETKMAYALVSHEFGLLFEALAEGLKSQYAELCSDCFLSATWLIHKLMVLPHTGVRGAARVCLLKRLVSIFKFAKDIEDRVLAMLALSSFIRDPEGLRDLSSHIKDVLKGLRELKRYSPLAVELLKILSEGNESSADLWNHKELVQVDCSSNGEVTSIVCFKDKLFSGHSDGTIKVWTGRGSMLHLIQEVREHTKAVTSLALLPSGERLYSGSLDRTTKVWSIGNEAIHCVQVHDMKDQVHNLVVANSIACFIPQGAGVKVHSWNGTSKLLNPNKYVKCLSLMQGKLYCGCRDNSIQEIDLATGTISNIQSGNRKLLGKSNPVQAIQLQGGLLYTASSPLDGAAVKIWSASNYDLMGSVPSTSEIRSMAVSSELIYLGCKGGFVEVWCKQKQNRVETLQVGSSAKVLSMALDAEEEFLVVGTSDGRIQAWQLS
ncbi:putative E3 ubiquitin-protein ligase LIN-1 isoform X2 [Punica granatum]|uniref:RING-type E3 ubiquitin transferase n=1 Tax=Punica granatum TaxID=22663 RepID=A0A6P8CQ07_PUNGR|nr:putative E3 ubiquitin-protein ligase LIN-1 isoform X2 [Punica granatum]